MTDGPPLLVAPSSSTDVDSPPRPSDDPSPPPPSPARPTPTEASLPCGPPPTASPWSSCLPVAGDPSAPSTRPSPNSAATWPIRPGTAPSCRTPTWPPRVFPPPVVFLVLGIIGLALRRPPNRLRFATPPFRRLLLVLPHRLPIRAVPYFPLPLPPSLVLLAAGALLGAVRRGTRAP